MKQFLYLDTDIVNSIIAQSQKGLIIQQTLENGSEQNKESTNREELTGEGSASGGFWKFVQASANLSGAIEFSHSKGTQSSTRDVVEKVLHDSAFDLAYEIIEPYKINRNDQSADEEGRYVELNRYFDFVDFDYIERLFSKDGLIDMLKKNSSEQIEAEAEKIRQGINRENFRKTGTSFKQEVKKAIDISNKQYDDIIVLIKALRSFIPYNRLLISTDGYLIPLDDKYFRVDPSNLGFKYGGDITCVGMITNIIGESTDPNDSKNIFATLQFTANEALRSILPTKETDLCVIHPIAVYYGE